MDSPYTNGNGRDYGGSGGDGGGITNGYGRDNYRSRERRQGGYGGMDLRPADLERRKANRRSGDGRWGASRSRSRPGDGRAVKQIEDVLQYIKQDWSFMTEERCVPVQIALQLLDPSSLGLASRFDEFKDAREQLQNALRGIVNEHHQGFNSSIGTFHQIQESIESSHNRIRTLKESLVDAKKNLTTTKTEFRNLVATSQNYEEMLEEINVIEKLQRLPEQVEASISEKRFIRAVDALQEALILCRGSSMEGLGALGELRVYLSNQEHSLTDILTEELHDHLYLKSPYCEDRWMSYAKLHGNHKNRPTVENQNTRQMYAFLEHLDTAIPLVEDTSRNPESDTFHYIYVIVEALTKLGHLEDAVDSLEQRLPVELFKVVDRSTTEVQQRHPSALTQSLRHDKTEVDVKIDDDSREVVLNDLLGTLYAKFEAIAESHRVFHEVVIGVAKRDATWNPRLTRGFKELWKLYQSEIRSLLHDYLSSDGSGGRGMAQGLAGEDNMFRHQRDKNKKVPFKMEWMGSAANMVKSDQDELVQTWQKFVPGLASLNSEMGSAADVEENHKDSSGTGHKLLVEPSVFNITCLLPPSILFLKRLRELIPPGSDIVVSTLTSFLNDFLVNVFHPQLEETLADHCSQSYIQLDAFQQDLQWSQHSQRPIFKGTIKFFDTVSTFCQMLDELTHDQLFSQLVITQINTYYDKCCAWYKALVTRAQPGREGRTLKIAALYAESGQICDTVQKLMDGEPDEAQLRIVEETSRLIFATDRSPLEDSDLISDRKTQAALCLMYTSMKWLASMLNSLRRISERATDSTGMHDYGDHPRLKRSLTSQLDNNKHASRVYLPLSQGTASLFDGVITGFQDLASLVLRTLHLELRCHAIRALTESFRGSFLLSTPTDSPDENVTRLITDLLEFNQDVASHLQASEQSFITRGLSYLLDTLVVHTTVRNISSMNTTGSQHMQLNARVLYHNILNIEPNGDLPRAVSYFRVFDQGPDTIIRVAKEGYGGTRPIKLNEVELQTLLKLWYSEAGESQNREEAMRAKKSLDDRLKQLEESMVKS